MTRLASSPSDWRSQPLKNSVSTGASAPSGIPCHSPARLRWLPLGSASATVAAMPVSSPLLPWLWMTRVGTATDLMRSSEIASEHEAIQIAGRIPSARIGSIEVRPVIDLMRERSAP